MARTSKKGNVVLEVETPGYPRLVFDLFTDSAIGDDLGLPSIMY